MSSTWFRGILAGLAGWILLVSSAQATVMIYWNTQQLSKRAQVVVQGTVVKQEVVQLDGHLWTDSHVRVQDSLRGAHARGTVVVVRQPGGQTPLVGERVAGVATFSVGEEVLVLGRSVGQVVVPVGMCLAKYRVVRGSDGVCRVQRDLNGATFAGYGRDGRFQLLHPHQPQQQRLSDLVRVIRAASRSVKGGAR